MATTMSAWGKRMRSSLDGEDLGSFAGAAGEAQDFDSEWCQAGFDGCSD